MLLSLYLTLRCTCTHRRTHNDGLILNNRLRFKLTNCAPVESEARLLLKTFLSPVAWRIFTQLFLVPTQEAHPRPMWKCPSSSPNQSGLRPSKAAKSSPESNYQESTKQTKISRRNINGNLIPWPWLLDLLLSVKLE